jgi:hypothetical protein
MMTLDEYGQKHVQLISGHDLSICWEADGNYENESRNTVSRISRVGNIQNMKKR